MGHFEQTRKLKFIDELGICGCGNPELVYAAIYNMLKDRQARGDFLVKIDENIHPYALYMAYMLDHQGFTEHGSSVYGAWLTSKGVELLEALEQFKMRYEFDYNQLLDDIGCDDGYFYTYVET